MHGWPAPEARASGATGSAWSGRIVPTSSERVTWRVRRETRLNAEARSERQILGEIAEIATRLKRLRGAPAAVDRAQIDALEQQSRAKWNEVRLLRAGPQVAGSDDTRSRSLYR